MSRWRGSWFGHGANDPGAIFVKALVEHHRGRGPGSWTLRHRFGAESVPLSLYFRTEDELLPWDRVAIAGCGARVLDVGAGAGAVTLALQAKGVEVTALEPDAELASFLKERGVERIVPKTLHEWEPERLFDTVLMLMNGAALAGTLDGLSRLLAPAYRVLRPGGALYIDSADLRDGEGEDGEYPGELTYSVEYAGLKSAPFPQLFVDPGRLEAVARAEGFDFEIVWRHGDGSDDGEYSAEGSYLARLTVPESR